MPFPWSKAIFSSRVISWSTRSARRSGESVLSIHGPCTDGVSASARERPRSKMAMTPSVHGPWMDKTRSEEHTSELQPPYDLVCRLPLEKRRESQVFKPADPH